MHDDSHRNAERLSDGSLKGPYGHVGSAPPVPKPPRWLPNTALEPGDSVIGWAVRCLIDTVRMLTGRRVIGALFLVGSVTAVWAPVLWEEATLLFYGLWAALAAPPPLTAISSLLRARQFLNRANGEQAAIPVVRAGVAVIAIAAISAGAIYLWLLLVAFALLIYGLYLALVVVGVVTGYWAWPLWPLRSRRPQPGEVWWAEILNDNVNEQTAYKVRPAVVMRTDGVRVWVLWATTQTHRRGQPGYLETSRLAGWPLGKESFLNLNSPRVLERDKLQRRAGVLTPAAFEMVRRAT